MRLIAIESNACRYCLGSGVRPDGSPGCEFCGGSGREPAPVGEVHPTAAELAAWLAERPELWAELQEAMRTATGGPLPSSDCVGGGR